MTCAKCGMSIDVQAGERLEAVRRPRAAPEIEIDPALPPTPSRFPLIPALLALGVVVGGVVFLVARRADPPAGPSPAEQAKLRDLEKLEAAFDALWTEQAAAVRSCTYLRELVHRPCGPRVNPALLAFEKAVLAISAPTEGACENARLAFYSSRLAAGCE